MDIISFMAQFQSEKDCLDYLREHRYEEFKCPKCHKDKFYMLYSRKCMECAYCGHQEYLTANTIFHKSSTPLIKWFYAIMLMTQSKKGVSALQIQRMIKVTYKTAWRMAHKIREAMDNDDDNDMFGGITQVDETWIGGKKKNNMGREVAEKSIVVGAVEHIDGKPTRVECEVIDTVDSLNLYQFIMGKIAAGTTLHTDQHAGYRYIHEKGYAHQTVNHSETFIYKGISTQSVEGFWSLLKRGIIGVYHHVSPQHLAKYLAEFEFRYNNRGDNNLFKTLICKV